MKKIFLIYIMVLISTLTFGADFIIKDYNVNVELRGNGVLDVREVITVEFSMPKHGIERLIPVEYEIEYRPGVERAQIASDTSKYKINLFNINVQGDNFTVYKEGKNRVVRIGRADITVSGLKTYDIRYSVYGAVLDYKNHQELLWNLIGNDWDTDIEKAEFSIKMPKQVDLMYKDYYVVTGMYGASEKNVNYKYDGIEMTGAIPLPLSAGEGITAGFYLPDKFVKADILLHLQLFLINNGYLLLGILLIIGVAAGGYLTWLKIGKDEETPTVVQFEPPKDFTPSEAGALIDDKIDTRDLTCLIYYWAGNGIIEIEETEGVLFGLGRDFILHKIMDIPETAPQFEKTMFYGLFGRKESVTISSLRNVFYRTLDKARGELNSHIDRQGLYVKGSREAGGGFMGLGGLMCFVSFFFIEMSLPLTICVLLAGVIAIGFGIIMPKKSPTGNEKYFILKGFREFIGRAEKPKIEVMMKENPAYFDKTLSFAIALGLGDKWAEKFEGLMTEPPRWYRSRHYHQHRFSAYAFSRSLNESMSAMSDTMSSRPSSKTGSSGFGGGGRSSGGGFGGGGGRSW